MTITACNYGSHDFVREDAALPWADGLHLHVCVLCDATYMESDRSCFGTCRARKADA